MAKRKKVKNIEKAKILLSLMRPVNLVMILIAIIISIIVSTGTLGSVAITIPAMVAAFFIAGAGNTLNDYYDAGIDTINRPDRPLPSGKINPQTVWAYAIILFGVGIVLSFFLPVVCIAIAIVNSCLLAIYAAELKKSGFFGNILISYLVASVFAFGAAAVGNLAIGVFLSIVAFFTNASREVIKDLEDIKGDEMFGAKTLPLLEGRKKSIFIASAFLIMTIIISPLPYLLGILSIFYMIVAGTANVIFAVIAISMLRKPTVRNAKINQKKIKIGAFIGLLAFLAGIVG